VRLARALAQGGSAMVLEADHLPRCRPRNGGLRVAPSVGPRRSGGAARQSSTQPGRALCRPYGAVPPRLGFGVGHTRRSHAPMCWSASTNGRSW
jgi:hypothetical protein